MYDRISANKNLRKIAHALAFSLLLYPLFTKAQQSSETRDSPEIAAILDAFQIIKQHYVLDVPDSVLAEAAIKGMASVLDKHSAYLPPTQATAFKALGGIGLSIYIDNSYLRVKQTIESSPAYRAGIQNGDRLISIDSRSTDGMTLQEAIGFLRGEPGSSIALTVEMADGNKKEVVLIREVVGISDVTSKVIESGYGYIRISVFHANTPQHVSNHFRTLYDSGARQGLILDLRDNPGGLLVSAVGVASIFLPPDTKVVMTEGRTSEDKRAYSSPSDEDTADAVAAHRHLKGLPDLTKTIRLVLLVNGQTASAAEVLAGALQDHLRAQVLGQKTIGKASVQRLEPLANGASLKVTTFRYYSPKGRSLHFKGVEPDIPISEPVTAASGTDEVVRQAFSHLKAMQ